jgi:hypothetical protein
MKQTTKKILITLAIIAATAGVVTGGYFLGHYLWSMPTNSTTENPINKNPLCGDGVCQKIEEIKNLCPDDCANTAVNNQSKNEKITENKNQNYAGFVVIHMEPGTGVQEQKNLTNPQTYWPNLVDLVTAADKYEIKLTLLFNPQWAEYILQDQKKLSLLRSWETNGHEIGYHQHGPQAHGMNYWNGYTNQTAYQNRPQYQGTINDAMNLLIQLPADGKIYTAGVAAEEDRKYDWPTGVPYRVDGAADGAVGSIKQETVMGQNILFLQHQIFIPEGENAITFEEAEKEMAAMKDGEYFGLVFHAHNFTSDTKDDYEELFNLLSKNLVIKAVKNILGN